MKQIRVFVVLATLAAVAAACTTHVPDEFRHGAGDRTGPAGVGAAASDGSGGFEPGPSGATGDEASGVVRGRVGDRRHRRHRRRRWRRRRHRGCDGDTEIRVATSATLSGATGFLGEERVGPIDACFQHINSQGGINGRKLRLIAYDDRGDPSQMLANVRKIYEEDKIIAFIAGASDAAGDYVTRNQIPTLVFGVTAPSFQSKFPTVYPIVGNMLLWTQEFVHGLTELGVAKEGMRVGMIFDTAPLDARPYLPYLKEAWEKIGAEVVTTDPFDLGGDCTSLVLKYGQLDVDWWDFQGVGFVGCLSAAYRQGYTPNIGWGDWPTSVAGIADLVGPAIQDGWGGAQGDQPDGKPRTKNHFRDEYTSVIKRYHPNIATVPHYESPVTIGYWSDARLLVDALKAQGPTITKAGINEWIQGVKNYELGITPPIKSMAPNCKTGSEVVWIAQLRRGDEDRLAYAGDAVLHEPVEGRIRRRVLPDEALGRGRRLSRAGPHGRPIS